MKHSEPRRVAGLAPESEAFMHAIAKHDELVAGSGLDIWLGNEPTFTLMQSTAPEWLAEAVGAEKTERARRVVLELAKQTPNGLLLRCVGRRYEGEPEPRFSFGLFARRDGRRVYDGPPDPWQVNAPSAGDLPRFHHELEIALGRGGHVCRSFTTGKDHRLVFARDGSSAIPEPDAEPRLLRGSIHQAPEVGHDTPDELAAKGLFLLQLRLAQDGCLELELPAVPNVELFCALLDQIAQAAVAAQLPALVLCGFPPPVTDEISFLTVTPDPAVVEINMPPFASVSAFMEQNRSTYAAAAAVGLSPFRLRHNGVVADSGGGGQMTFGGSSPRDSPFLRVPHLLPRLLRYVLRHPACSYLFAHDYVGPSGQSVRPDELGADLLRELRLSLKLLDARPDIDPATLWLSLAPCLTDPTGNAHRAELNVEKLWNPAQTGRGQLGLVELRALRMQDTVARVAALGALLRSVIAMLMVHDYREDPPDHGSALHDRFALPFFLEVDLEQIFSDLAAAGFGLEPPLQDELRRDTFRHLATVEHAGVTLTLRRALEFWPLLGDATLQQGTSRLVDASTTRLELVLRASSPESEHLLHGWQLRALGQDLPLRGERDRLGAARVFGVRYRSYLPRQGLHPLLGEQSPLTLSLSHPTLTDALELTLHDWKPEGGGYDALPHDVEEAQRRCLARCLTERRSREQMGAAIPSSPLALSAYSLDLRYPPGV